MSKLTRQTPAMKKVVRSIQRWLYKHEYETAFKIKMHSTGVLDYYYRPLALCRTGVVVSAGGGCIINHWTDYTASDLKLLLNGAKKVRLSMTQNENTK